MLHGTEQALEGRAEDDALAVWKEPGVGDELGLERLRLDLDGVETQRCDRTSPDDVRSGESRDYQHHCRVRSDSWTPRGSRNGGGGGGCASRQCVEREP